MEIVELGEAGRIVTWVEPTATDLSGAVDVSRTRAPDEFFIVGDTTVIYTFTDSSMNTAECVFTVRVTTGEYPFKNHRGVDRLGFKGIS